MSAIIIPFLVLLTSSDISLTKRVLKVAKDFDGKVSFAVSDAQDFHQEVEALGLTDDGKTPSAGIYDRRGKYAMEETFSVDNLRQFVNTYLDGGLEPYMKSEPIPEPNDGPVKVTHFLLTTLHLF